MNDYADTTLREHRRLHILQQLESAAEYASNSETILDILRGAKLSTTRDQLVTELAWLKEQGFVAVDGLDGDFVGVTATVRGVEVARGQAFHPGVRRPGPRR